MSVGRDCASPAPKTFSQSNFSQANERFYALSVKGTTSYIDHLLINYHTYIMAEY